MCLLKHASDNKSESLKLLKAADKFRNVLLFIMESQGHVKFNNLLVKGILGCKHGI